MTNISLTNLMQIKTNQIFITVHFGAVLLSIVNACVTCKTPKNVL